MGERGAGWVLKGIGALMLALGVGALALAPLEMICFYWFSEGGRFGYEGFGFGSFMFGNMAMQIVGYYGIAVLAIPLGFGHWTLRRWVRPVMLALLRIWWILGIPLLVVLLFVLLASKDLTTGAAIAALVAAVLSYAVLPVVLTRFYRDERVLHMLEDGEPAPSWAERIGVPALSVLGLELFWLVALHLLLFFRGVFPLLTSWATGLNGLALVDGAVLTLLLILWGTARRKRWAWWAALDYFGLMTVLWAGTLVDTQWAALLNILAFPPTEVSILGGMPLEGWHLAVLVGLPLAGTLGAVAGMSPRQGLSAAE